MTDKRAEANRREALKLFLAGAGCYAVTAGQTASAQTGEMAGPLGRYVFPNGVASGDPMPDGVVLWTRVLPADGSAEPVPVLAEVSETPAFETIVAAQIMEATAGSDHTVRLFVTGLAPDQVYFYRFRAGGDVSAPLGRTITAPAPDDARPITFATASCQNYQSGSFAAYRHMLQEDEARAPEDRIRAVVHMGDFIYEAIYRMPDETGALRQFGVREVPPFPSGGGVTGDYLYAQTLDDYRHLYKTYLSDPDLIAARARWPFVCTWDDHEFTNDSWQSQETFIGEGKPAQRRKVAANQAWFEFMPALLTGARGVGGVAPRARDFSFAEVEDAPITGVDEDNRSLEPNNRAAVETLTIYRSLRFGAHMELVVSDMRSYRSDHPVPETLSDNWIIAERAGMPVSLVDVLDAGREANDGNPPDEVDVLGETVANPRRASPPGTMMGPDQKAWWKATMARSGATWKVWATSVPVMPLRVDISKAEESLEDVVMSTDAWDGYPRERRELGDFLHTEGIGNVIAVSGDHHAGFAGVLARDFSTDEAEPVAVEFSTPGISSPSFYSQARMVSSDQFQTLVAYRPLTWTGRAAEHVANLNATLLYGVRTAAVAAYTGLIALGRWFRNPEQNPHLAHIDTDAYGYTVVRVSAGRADAEQVVIEAPRLRDGQDATVRYRIRYGVPAWAGGEPARLEGPEFTGTPPFPFGS